MYINTTSYPPRPIAPNSLYKQLHLKVQSYILNRHGTIEDTKDIFQEATLIWLERQTSTDIHKDTEAYFFGICKNLWHRQLRKRKRIVEGYVLDSLYHDTSHELDPIDQRQKDQLFEVNFSKLNGTAKRIWNLCFDGNTHSEIAALTGWSDAYIRKKKSEAKKSLTQMIRQDPLFMELQDYNAVVWN